MQSQDNNTEETFIAKRVKPRYININENIYLALSGDAIKLYLALRFESDYSKDCSSVEKNIQFLCNQARISRSRCFEVINELEDHGLLFRQSKSGKQSIYWVASDLNYFLNPENIPVHNLDGSNDPSTIWTTPVQNLDTIINNSFTNKTNISDLSIEQKLYSNSEQQRQALIFRDECLSDPKSMELYEQLPEEFKKDTSFVDMYEACVSHNATKAEPKLVGKHKLQCWIKKALAYPKLVEVQKQCSNYSVKEKPGDSFSRVMSKYLNQQGGVFDESGNTINSFC